MWFDISVGKSLGKTPKNPHFFEKQTRKMDYDRYRIKVIEKTTRQGTGRVTERARYKHNCS